MGYVLNYSARNPISKRNNILLIEKKKDSIVMEESLVTCPGVYKLVLFTNFMVWMTSRYT